MLKMIKDDNGEREFNIRQAEEYKHIMINILRDKYKLQNIPVGYGYVFPYCDFCIKNQDNLEINNDRVIDRDKFNNDFLNNLKRLINFNLTQIRNDNKYINPDVFSSGTFDRVVKIFRKDIDTVSIKSFIEHVNDKIIKLTEEQYNHYSNIIENDVVKNYVLHGPAGTGKTVIGKKLADYYLQRGKKVGFFCYNELLGNYIKSQFGDNQNIKAGTIYAFILDIISLAGLKQDFNNECLIADNKKIYGELYFKYFKIAYNNLKQNNQHPQFDVLIVDEMQDLSYQRYLDLFNFITHQNSKIIFLADYENQNIQQRRYDDPVNIMDERDKRYFRLRLSRNCRNTLNIIKLVNKLAAEMYKEIPDNIEKGPPIKICTYNNNNFLNNLDRELLRLIDQGIKLDHITILSMKSKKDTLLSSRLVDNGKFYQFDGNQKVRFETVRRYKGLENEIIMVVDLDANLDPHTRRFLYYVAFTRAKVMLYIFRPSGFNIGDLRDIAEYM